MANRYSRDQLIQRALDMVDAPHLDAHERATGTVIDPWAYAVQWLQDALDLFHNEFPWAGIVTSTAVVFTPNVASVTLPLDFILDVRDGLVLTDTNARARLRRTSLQKYISATTALSATDRGTPGVYIVQPPWLKVAPTPDRAFAGTLWYYALPVSLGPNDRPNFPSDWCLIEYIRLRGLEWTRSIPVGSAIKYGREQIAELRKAGLGHEPEDDEIPFDSSVLLRGAGGTGNGGWSWMGDTRVVP